MKHDATNGFLQLHYFLSECLHAGVWPLWNPFMGLGIPFHADMQTSVHYFPSWIIAGLFKYNMYLYHLEFLLHLAIGGLGMFFFIRYFKLRWEIALACALFYTLSGHFLSNAQHQSWIVSTAYLPWVWALLLRFFKKPNAYYALGLALSNSLMLTGGYPAFLLLNAYAIAIYLVFNFPRKVWKPFLIWGSVALAIFILTSFGYLYSTWEVWAELARAEGMSYEAANMNPYSPQSLLGLLNPQILVREQAFFGTDATMTNIYQGLFFSLLLLLSFWVKKSQPMLSFLGLAILFLLLAFGDYFILRRWTFWMPFMDLFRHIGIFRIFSILFFYPLVAITLNQLAEHSNLQAVFRIILLSFIGLFSCYLLMGLIFGKHFLSWHLIVGSSLIQLLFLILGFVMTFPRFNFSLSKLLLLNLVNLLIIHQFNVPSSLVHERSLYEFQKVLNQTPAGFQANLYHNEPMAAMNNFGTEASIPIYYNWSVFSKKFAHDQYYPFVLKTKAALEKQADYWQLLGGSLLHAPYDSSLSIQLVDYHPNQYQFELQSPQDQILALRFMQNNYQHWEVYLNGERIYYEPEQALIELKAIPLKTGKNKLQIRYYSRKVVISMAIGLMSSLFLSILLFILYLRLSKTKKT